MPGTFRLRGLLPGEPALLAPIPVTVLRRLLVALLRLSPGIRPQLAAETPVDRLRPLFLPRRDSRAWLQRNERAPPGLQGHVRAPLDAGELVTAVLTGARRVDGHVYWHRHLLNHGLATVDHLTMLDHDRRWRRRLLLHILDNRRRQRFLDAPLPPTADQGDHHSLADAS